MAYLHIDNLYKNQDILLFKECYALEKIHGTSAHISWKNNEIRFFSGGEKHEKFVSLFDKDTLISKFKELDVEEIVIYGEAYGGKCQGMSGTYGEELKFVVFDVKIGEYWLSVPDAENVAIALVLEFVHYRRISTNLAEIDRERDYPSKQAYRNGIKDSKKAEGIVLRPLMELSKNNGKRIICKHKRDDFRETNTSRKVSPEKLVVLSKANEVADEWVTPMRLSHILDKIEDPSMEKMGDIIKAMVADVKREGEGEIEWSKSIGKAIGKKTALMTKEYFQNKLTEGV